MIAIKGMKKPESCWDCPILCLENGECEMTKKYIYGNDIPTDCPLVEIEERKKGKWIFTKTIFDKYGCTAECPCCHKKWKTYDEIRWKKENKFCPNCGAEMEEAEE